MSANYLNLAARAPRRLAILRANAVKHNEKHGKSHVTGLPQDWRGARYASFTSDGGLSAGFNGEGRTREAVWYAHDGETFPREKFADECENVRVKHTGWYCDGDGCDKARGVVVALPHGRFIAGYHMSCNDERVYFSELHDSERDAAHMADEHARIIAENETEYQEKYRDAQKLDEDTDSALQRLRECLALRNSGCFEHLRDEARELIETIKGNRFALATTYKGVL